MKKISLTVVCLAMLLVASGCKGSGAGNSDSSAGASTAYIEFLQDFDYKTRAHMKVQIKGEGYPVPEYSFSGLQPYFDEMGLTMFPMVHFDMLFEGNVSYEIEGGKVTITKNVLDVITIVSVSTDSYIILKDGQEIWMRTKPVQKDGTIYIPLEFVGKALGYGVKWRDWDGKIQFGQYTSVYVYFWNEDEESSPDGLRYSYIISGDYTTDMSEISKNATPDYEEIRAVLKKLPPEAVVMDTAMYHAKGYAIPPEVYYEIEYGIFEL